MWMQLPKIALLKSYYSYSLSILKYIDLLYLIYIYIYKYIHCA